MTVIAPSACALAAASKVAYTAGLAGSGFVADVTIMPRHVSFSRIQVREETAVATATGYYDKVMHWKGITHPRTPIWISINAANAGPTDTVGTVPPGTRGPFSAGKFVWPIPQSYRVVGSGGPGAVYSIGVHVQVMMGSNGVEGTAKEGASRGRAP